LVSNHFQILSHRHQQVQTASEHRLKAAVLNLNNANPLTTLTKGFAIVTKDQKIVKDASTLETGDIVDTKLMTGSFSAKVLKTHD
jgi:exonuclease VII large subunit